MTASGLERLPPPGSDYERALVGVSETVHSILTSYGVDSIRIGLPQDLRQRVIIGTDHFWSLSQNPKAPVRGREYGAAEDQTIEHTEVLGYCESVSDYYEVHNGRMFKRRIRDHYDTGPDYEPNRRMDIEELENLDSEIGSRPAIEMFKLANGFLLLYPSAPPPIVRNSLYTRLGNVEIISDRQSDNFLLETMQRPPVIKVYNPDSQSPSWSEYILEADGTVQISEKNLEGMAGATIARLDQVVALHKELLGLVPTVLEGPPEPIPEPRLPVRIGSSLLRKVTAR